MGDALLLQNRERAGLAPVRGFANQAFSRAAGAPLIGGNRIRLLINAQENYPAWLEAIGGAQRHVHFENYIIHEYDAGRMFAEALVAKAREGVRVRVIYDWASGKRPALSGTCSALGVWKCDAITRYSLRKSSS